MSILHLVGSQDQTILPIKVAAGSHSNRIQGVFNGRLKIGVVAAAEKGKANEAVVSLLAKKIRLPKRNIEIVAGVTHNEKRLAIGGITAAELVVRLQHILGPAEIRIT